MVARPERSPRSTWNPTVGIVGPLFGLRGGHNLAPRRGKIHSDRPPQERKFVDLLVVGSKGQSVGLEASKQAGGFSWSFSLFFFFFCCRFFCFFGCVFVVVFFFGFFPPPEAGDERFGVSASTLNLSSPERMEEIMLAEAQNRSPAQANADVSNQSTNQRAQSMIQPHNQLTSLCNQF